jgi:N-acetyl-anhydromuramyl-L-alanine amidase AmpD
MIIEESKVNQRHYNRKTTEKKQIVLGNIYSYDKDYFLSSLDRNGSIAKCPHFSIDEKGIVYQHFNIKHHSRYLDADMDEYCISIGLYNMGYLFEKSIGFFDIFNNSYKGDVFHKNWKNCGAWQPYTEAQLKSSIELCKYLLEQTNIPHEVIPINVCKQDIDGFKGICYRSNHHVKHYDLNPSWDFKKFKTEIENGRSNETNEPDA